jgi:predicted RND superfamily exporter protein
VVTWVFSPLQFQADIGIMLTFMFFVNMLGAIILLPALAAWFVRGVRPHFPAKGAGPLSPDA